MAKQQSNQKRQEIVDSGRPGMTVKPSGSENPVNRIRHCETSEQATPDETGGPKGLEPTRYGDWEINGRCSDF